MTDIVNSIIAALREHKNVLLYGPPGTGKSFLMKEVANQWHGSSTTSASESVVINSEEERVPFSTEPRLGLATRWVTFHQGYSYEDFILGMRPITSDGVGFSVEPKPGVLLELAAMAKSGGEGLLLIDEINRGNTSKIFGEFITLMEPDKRLNAQGSVQPTTVTVTLPYLSPGEKVEISVGVNTETISRNFQMPSNVYTLASMNSVDKSISPLDTAFRRRFHIVNLAPTEMGVRDAVGLEATQTWDISLQSENLSSESIRILSVALMIKLNRAIGFHLGSDFMLGQWYLVGLKDATDSNAATILSELWLYKLLPQLIELFQGRDEQLAKILGPDNITHTGSALILHVPSEEEGDLGATSYLEVAPIKPSQTEVVKFLQAVVSSN